MSEKLIFLDIDGVLVTGRGFVADHTLSRAGFECVTDGRTKQKRFTGCDFLAVDLLVCAARRCGAKFVITSTKRKNHELGELYEILGACGFPRELLAGITPRLRTRGEEILAFLDWYKKEWPLREVDEWAVVDDCEYDFAAHPDISQRFLHIGNPENGFGMQDYRDLTTLLGNPDPAYVYL